MSDEDLRKRNFLHYALFHHITALPLRQVVIYGGTGLGTQIKKNHLSLSGLEFQFEVIVLKDIPKEVFLNSTIPEEVILAILCDFGQDAPDVVIRQILSSLNKILKGSFRVRKYQKQLLILSRLRKMELIVKTQVEAMTIHYDIETDGLYLQGREEGIELEKQEFIHTLWSLQEFSLEKIAMMVKCPEEKVLEVILDLLQFEGLNEVEALAVVERYKVKFK